MQFSIIFNNFFHQSIVDLLNPVFTIRDNSTNPLDKLSRWSLSIDKQILDQYKKVDWILYCNSADIRLENFYVATKFGNKRKSIFAVDHQDLNLLDQNFYCTPETFSYFGSNYKLSTPNIINNITDQNKLFYMSLRINLEIISI